METVELYNICNTSVWNHAICKHFDALPVQPIEKEKCIRFIMQIFCEKQNSRNPSYWEREGGVEDDAFFLALVYVTICVALICITIAQIRSQNNKLTSSALGCGFPLCFLLIAEARRWLYNQQHVSSGVSVLLIQCHSIFVLVITTSFFIIV